MQFASPIHASIVSNGDQVVVGASSVMALSQPLVTWDGMHSFNRRSIELLIGRIETDANESKIDSARLVLRFGAGLRRQIPESEPTQKDFSLEEGLKIIAKSATQFSPAPLPAHPYVTGETGPSLNVIEREYIVQMDFEKGAPASFDVRPFRLAESPVLVVHRNDQLTFSLHPFLRESQSEASGLRYGFLKRERDPYRNEGKIFVSEDLLTITQAAAEVREAMKRPGNPFFDALQKLSV